MHLCCSSYTYGDARPVNINVVLIQHILIPSTDASLRGCQAVLEKGRDCFSLQRSPHLVLLDLEYYRAHIRPLAAKWCLLWLHQNCPEQLPIPNDLLLLYLQGLPLDTTALTPPGRSPIFLRLCAVSGTGAARPVSLSSSRSFSSYFFSCRCAGAYAMKLLNLATAWSSLLFLRALPLSDARR